VLKTAKEILLKEEKLIKIILYLSLMNFLFAADIEINYSDKKFENFKLSYIEDKNSSYTISQLQNMQLKPISNRHGISGKTGPTWYRLTLKNVTDIEQKLFLHNSFAYYSKEITIFEFANHKLLDQNIYNILSDKSVNPLIGSTLVYKFFIAAHSQTTLYIKNVPMVSNLFNLNLYNERASLEALFSQSFYSLVVISIMLTLAFYNATLYFFNRRKEFLLYALYIVTPAIGLMYKYGIIFSYFHLYGESTYLFNITAIIMPAFLILFIQQVLNTKEMHRSINYMLNTIIVIIILNISLAVFHDLTIAMEVFKLMFIATTMVLIYLSYYLFKHSHPLATIFATAYGFYIIGMIITILSMSGIIEMSYFTFHSGGIGIILEGLLFSYLMHYNVKILEQKIRQQREVIISKNKKAQLGDMISAITHQWKQPLTRVTSITTLLEFKLNANVEISPKMLKDKIAQINSNIHFLSDTIDDFKDFFNPNNKVENCDIETIVERAISLSNDDTLTKEITIVKEININKELQLYKNEFLHIILNIIQNSKEAFKNSTEEIKLIKIIGYTKDDKVYIDIIDNAGGIQQDTLPFIFNEHYTTKENQSGSGLGLYLSKVILEDHLKGSIEASNIKGGAMFRIIL